MRVALHRVGFPAETRQHPTSTAKPHLTCELEWDTVIHSVPPHQQLAREVLIGLVFQVSQQRQRRNRWKVVQCARTGIGSVETSPLLFLSRTSVGDQA